MITDQYQNNAELGSDAYDFELSKVPAPSVGRNGVPPLLHVKPFMLDLHVVIQRKYSTTC